uniref:NADH-ubiquinone oxidoreductase chain 2 n=1 Tax=Dosinia troscheli TaxID=870214 RepID=A0A2S1U279_9BIVA|nr:NADH dehydrogenase subunit 2 [Dosinia troscheli]AWI68000.1 NADH dehydrogenase subunit 2 [Dosinia troscheli]
MMMVLSSISSLVSLIVALVGVIISMISLNMLGLWVGVELNFLGAVCFLSGVSVEESESVMKYFIIQVFGSCFLILGFLMMMNYCFVSVVKFIVLLGILVKLGVFPFHFWVPSVMSGLSWFGCFIVSVIQKVVPLWLVSNLLLMNTELGVVELLASLTCVVGCLGGLGVLSYRVLLGYSSLVHLGFMLILCCVDEKCFLTYMSFYFLINFCLMSSFWNLGVYSFLDFVKEDKLNFLNEVWWSSLYFLSLSGLPPFSGCVLKVYFVWSSWNFMSLGCVVCVLSSIVSLYFYLSVVVSVLIYWGKSVSILEKKSSNMSCVLSGTSAFVNLGIGLMVFLLVGL